MAAVTVEGQEYRITTAELADYEEMVAQGIDQIRALQIATGDYQDLIPPPEPET